MAFALKAAQTGGLAVPLEHLARIVNITVVDIASMIQSVTAQQENVTKGVNQGTRENFAITHVQVDILGQIALKSALRIALIYVIMLMGPVPAKQNNRILQNVNKVDTQIYGIVHLAIENEAKVGSQTFERADESVTVGLSVGTNSKSSKKINLAVVVESTISLVDHGHATDPRGGLIRTKKIISMKNLHVIIEKMAFCESAGFKNEYMEIKKGELFPCLEAKKPENMSKNRYKTTYAYDHSRVVLSTLSNGSDYINANFIEDAQGQRAYIATQGPKSKTITDFWSMVWQEKLNIIVCLTNLKEGEKIKCSQYWPNNDEQVKVGEFTICSEQETVYADYVIRTLRLRRKNIKTNLTVMMFHYTKWPDHGVPDPLSLVIFHRHVMRMSDISGGKYTLVHCSAGIGRTGTYIALDALYREGEKTGKVNVQKYVEIMRKDRMNMIQGSDQYEIVYLALYESFRGKAKCMSTDSFLQEYQQHSKYSNSGENPRKSSISVEFEELRNLRKEYSKNDFESGHGNREANYTPSILPVEEFRCYLDYVKNRGTYYNAVLLKSITSNDILISAQYPLPDYTEDFLRLLTDFDVRIAVFLSPLRDISSSTLWLPFKKETKTLGSFTVRFAESSNSNNINTTEVLLKREGSGDIKRLAILECRAWKEGLSFDRRALLDAIKETKIEKILTGRRILILSNDGVKRCGPFCIVYNCLEQISKLIYLQIHVCFKFGDQNLSPHWMNTSFAMMF
ncbi:receptor-type tyrosine-protein phosphatase alpha-like [Saccostrea echinata]|uniref:receptor-type tyrosine-protein phosphatase alpha-like n=1 Tax=Saccostrea echinata TaxID=191078 RepID=UPI002A80F95B|nr:receptor-type tyrosine-protein phosphatase alpha-like [Saccostrea echinata]